MLTYSNFDVNNNAEIGSKSIWVSFNITLSLLPNFKYLPENSFFSSNSKKPYINIECSKIEYFGPFSSKNSISDNIYEPGDSSVNDVLWYYLLTFGSFIIG